MWIVGRLITARKRSNYQHFLNSMPSYESIIEWYKGTGLRPYLEQLSETDGDEFTSDVFNELKHRYKTQKNGEILFRFPRLFFVVKKNDGRIIYDCTKVETGR